MKEIKTAEEVLADAHGILPQYLNWQLGKITAERNIEAMQAHTRAALEALRRDIINKYNTGATDFDIAGIDLEQFIK